MFVKMDMLLWLGSARVQVLLVRFVSWRCKMAASHCEVRCLKLISHCI